MTDLRAELSNYCAAIGQDRLLVQGPGGNASWKDGETLWVKASGTWLAEALAKDIFLPVDLVTLQQAMAAGDFAVQPEALTDSAMRPSIETLFHALLPHRVVLHTHAINPLARLVRTTARQEVERLIGSAYPWIFVDYAKPGPDLAAAIHAGLQQVADAQVIFMQNHGHVVGGATVAEVASVMTDVNQRLACDIPSPVTADTPFPETTVPGYRPARDTELQVLMQRPDLQRRIAQDWALYPDHVVFLGAAPMWGPPEEASPHPPYIFSKTFGVLESQGLTPGARSQMLCYLDVFLRQPPATTLTRLDPSQISALLNWDAEKFRQSIAPTDPVQDAPTHS